MCSILRTTERPGKNLLSQQPHQIIEDTEINECIEERKENETQGQNVKEEIKRKENACLIFLMY